MRIRFLGTSSAVPTDDRGLPSILIKTNGDSMLIDCGDGTQRQMIKARESLYKLDKVIITHLHGDHFFGLFPLIQSLGILRKTGSLTIVGPKDLGYLIEEVREKTGSRQGFDLIFQEIEVGKEFSLGKFRIEFFRVDHAGFETYGIKVRERDRPGRFDPQKADELGVPPILRGVLQRGFTVKLPDGKVVRPEDVMGPLRKGAILVYSSDTRPTEEVIRVSKEADLLIHEATYLDDLKERAIATGHSTALEAAEVASEAGVPRLALTHFSARYRDEDLPKFEEEARKKFSGEIIVARDFMILDL